MKYLLCAFTVALFVLNGCSALTPRSHETLFQVSTINALMEGVYEGSVTVAELRKRGNFGIGTVNGLDGELIMLDGQCYQVKDDGSVSIVEDEVMTPFAVVTSFKSNQKVDVLNIESYDHLKQVIDVMIPSDNIFYAIKVEGNFNYVKTRSVPRQYRPYPRLAEALENQTLFEFKDVGGTLVGFWFPEYIKDINDPGYHLHFLNSSESGGGHLLDCKIRNATITIDSTLSFFMVLPGSNAFYSADLMGATELELDVVEMGSN